MRHHLCHAASTYYTSGYNRSAILVIDGLGSDNETHSIYKAKNHKISLRLKGDHLDHLRGKKWSFRVKVKRGNTLLGMKQFSLHHPKTRNYL